jgi:pilus assembly protein CpaB
MRQIIVLGVALLAAVAALFLVRGMATKAPPPQTQSVITNGVPVLIATRALEQGDTAAPNDLAWANFPQDSLSETYIQQSSAPKAIEDFTGAVARFPIEKGEPVTASKLVKAGGEGFMAAMLEPGYRAISVSISDESAAAGFILPNDRVDVLVTRRLKGEAGDGVTTNTILENVRVLAIDGHYRAPTQDKEPTTMTGRVATLELSPRDAETLALADKIGDISLVLRSVKEDAQVASAAKVGRDGTGSVRIHRFGDVTETTVKTAAGASQ